MARTLPQVRPLESLRTEILRSAKGLLPLDAVLAKGWTYTQVLNEIAALQLAGLVERQEGKLSITASGLAALKRWRAAQALAPRPEVRLENTDNSAVYVPPVASLREIEEAISTAGTRRRGVESTS